MLGWVDLSILLISARVGSKYYDHDQATASHLEEHWGLPSSPKPGAAKERSGRVLLGQR